MRTLRSASASSPPKTPQSNWSTKYGGTNTRSRVLRTPTEDHEFFSLDLKSFSPQGQKRSRSIVSSNHSSFMCDTANSGTPPSSQELNNIIDLTLDESPLARKKPRQSIPICNFSQPRAPRFYIEPTDIQPCEQEPSASANVVNDKSDTAIIATKYIEKAEARVGFLSFPIEIQQHVAEYLDTDADIANLGLVCRSLKAHMSASVWRQRAVVTFDAIEGADPSTIAEEYKKRQQMYKRFTRFDDLDVCKPRALAQQDEFFNQRNACLSTLRDLITESDAQIILNEKEHEVIIGLNHDFLKKYIEASRPKCGYPHGSNILDVICNTDHLFANQKEKSSRSRSSLILVLQLSLLHLVFDPNICNSRAQKFPTSQQHVYESPNKTPIFKGKNRDEIDLTWLLHVANFFKFHLKQGDGEGVLAHTYRDMNQSEQPRAWPGKLSSETKELGKKWKGTFTYMDRDDLQTIRGGRAYDFLVDEVGEGNNGFQDLTLFFGIDEHPELHFPEKIEPILRGKPARPQKDYITNKKLMPEVKDFFGLGYNGYEFHLNGRLHALPPQQGIPGFQRITMMSYLPNQDDGTYGPNTCWAYEGCVMPGSQIMLGRWYSAFDGSEDDDVYSGPFIFWRVEECLEDKFTDVKTALNLLDDIEWDGVY